MDKNIEAEGGELVLQNTTGDTIIIPKNRREEALTMLENNDYEGIDELASNLPYMEDYAEDGTLVPNEGNINPDGEPRSKRITNQTTNVSIRGGGKKTLHPNIQDKDLLDYYTDPSTDNTVKLQKKMKSMSNEEQFNTFGITANQVMPQTGLRDLFRTRLSGGPSKYGYQNIGESAQYSGGSTSEIITKVGIDLLANDSEFKKMQKFQLSKDPDKVDRDRVLNQLSSLYYGYPIKDPKNSSIRVSKYKPSSAKDSNSVYYDMPEGYEGTVLSDAVLGSIHEKELARDKNLKDLDSQISTLSGLPETGVLTSVIGNLKQQKKTLAEKKLKVDELNYELGNYSVYKGEDKEGEYISYYDQWDLHPLGHSSYNPLNWGEELGLNDDQSQGVGKKVELYGRKYFIRDENNIPVFKDTHEKNLKWETLTQEEKKNEDLDRYEIEMYKQENKS